MSQQNQSQSFKLRIADSETSRLGEGDNHCESSVQGSTSQHAGGLAGNSISISTIDLMAAYRVSRVAAQQSLASMRIGPSSPFGSTSSYRMVG